MTQNKSNLKYYQDWIRLFNDLKTYIMDEEIYEICIKGDLVDKKTTLILFEKALLENVNFLLNRVLSRFSKQINLVLEFGDHFDISHKVNILKRDLKYISFFKQLSFLDKQFKDEIEKSFEENVQSYFDMFLKQIKKHTCDNDSIFELYYHLQSVKL